MALRGHMIEFTGKDGAQVGAYHVQPVGARKGGLVLLQEIFGVTEHIKEQADRFAAAGYEVIAPALYDRLERGFECDYSEAGIKRALELRGQHDDQLSIDDVDVCRGMLDGPVFIAGYCYGGSITWMATAALDGFAAGSAYYGRLIPDHLDHLPKCPVICHFGEFDKGIPMDWVAKVQDVVASHDHLDVFVYLAGHGFQSDRRKDYHAESDKLAWDRTMALFEAQL